MPIEPKPLKYAENVPEFMRSALVGPRSSWGPDHLESQTELKAKAKLIKELNELAKEEPLSLLERGIDDWHLWVKANAAKWLTDVDMGDHILISFAEYEGEPYESDYLERNHGIDFSTGQSTTKDEEYKFTYIINNLNCNGYYFPCPISFKRATFEGTAHFTKATFEGTTHFNGAKFEGTTGFDKATFEGITDFTEATFETWADFYRTAFKNFVSFDAASFEDIASFNEAKFKGVASFEGTTFKDWADFDRSRFENWADFERTTFKGVANFLGVTFEGNCTCLDTVYVGPARWDDSVFTKTVTFAGAHFTVSASFKNCDFQRHADFDHVWFGKTPDTPKPEKFEEWPEASRKAWSAIGFNHQSNTVPNFKGADFKTAPNLGFTHVPTPPPPPVEGRVHSRMWQRIQRFWGLDPASCRIGDEEAAAKYRRLGELAARGHHHQAEAKFFRSELLTRRGHEAEKPADIIMINLFELFSGSGLSFKKPIDWLLRLILLCGLCYGLAADSAVSFNVYETIIAVIAAALSLWQPRLFIPAFGAALFAAYYFCSDIYGGGFQFGDAQALTWAELGIFTGLNSLPVIGLASNSHAHAVAYLFGGSVTMPVGIQILAFLQNLLSAVLLFFALLSIRNYFKLG